MRVVGGGGVVVGGLMGLSCCVSERIGDCWVDGVSVGSMTSRLYVE